MQLLNLPVQVTFQDDVYIARCHLIQWAFAEWDTAEESIKELIDVIQMIMEYRKEKNVLENYKVDTNKYFTTLPLMING